MISPEICCVTVMISVQPGIAPALYLYFFRERWREREREREREIILVKETR